VNSKLAGDTEKDKWVPEHAENVYPVTSAVRIEDHANNKSMFVVTEHIQGGTSQR